MKSINIDYGFRTNENHEKNLIHNIQIAKFDIKNIMLDSFGNESFCDITKQTISLTISNRENRRLIVCFALNGNQILTISTVTYGGVPLIRLIRLSGGDNKIELWDLISPKVGTHDLVINIHGAANYLDVGYAVIYNASQQNNISINSGTAIFKNIIASVSPILNGCWFLSVGYPKNNLIQSSRGGDILMNNRFAWGTYSFSKAANKHSHIYKGLNNGEKWIWVMIAVSPASTVMDRISQSESEILTDNFSDEKLDSKWLKFTRNGGDVYEKNGRLHFKLKNSKRVSWAGIQSKKTYDFRGCFAEMEIIYAQKGDAWLDLILSREKLPSNNFIIIGVDVSGKRNNLGKPALTALLQVNGIDNLLAVLDYDPHMHRYVRIREDCGTVYFEWSSDGQMWKELHNMSNPFDMSSLYLIVDDFAYSNASKPEIHIVGNLKVAPYEKHCFVDIETHTEKKCNLLKVGDGLFFELKNMDKLEKGKYHYRVRLRDLKENDKWEDWKKCGVFEIN